MERQFLLCLSTMRFHIALLFFCKCFVNMWCLFYKRRTNQRVCWMSKARAFFSVFGTVQVWLVNPLISSCKPNVGVLFFFLTFKLLLNRSIRSNQVQYRSNKMSSLQVLVCCFNFFFLPPFESWRCRDKRNRVRETCKVCGRNQTIIVVVM